MRTEKCRIKGCKNEVYAKGKCRNHRYQKYQKAYRKTAKYKAYRKAYQKTEKCRAYQRAYYQKFRKDAMAYRKLVEKAK